jgi:hypothetical protein
MSSLSAVIQIERRSQNLISLSICWSTGLPIQRAWQYLLRLMADTITQSQEKDNMEDTIRILKS